MVDPHRGSRVDTLYRAPVNAILAHPVLLLVAAGFGVLVALLSPSVCIRMFDPTQCRALLGQFGWGLALLGVGAFLLVRLRREDLPGEQ